MTDNDSIRSQLDRFSDEELEEILLDRDKERWRPEVFEVVAAILESRGISTRELLAASSGKPDEDSEWADGVRPADLITVAQYMDPLEAHADRLALEQAGLKSWVVGDSHEDGIMTSLRVSPCDLGAAMGILDAAPVPASSLSGELAAPQCPRCGSHDVTEEAEDLDVLDPASSSLSGSKRQMWLYRCASCKHTWSA